MVMRAREEELRNTVSIRKGDRVRVMKGRDRDAFRARDARVLSVDPVRMVVTVEHAHMVKRHTRANPSKNIKGGIAEREAPIHISNVRLVCPGCHKAVRVGRSVTFETVSKKRPDGSAYQLRERRFVARICRKCGATF
jgi:large subunit ribosomal protein L24